MKKEIKIFLIILGFLLGVTILDTLQAKILVNSPIMHIRKYYDKGEINYIDKGLLIDYYKYTNGKERVLFVWEKRTY